ncbi:MAG TPA: glycoside hydrolase family 78 protein [Sedimentisphaerales bacterium]|nr:glycoside hydrolase family 78 protein [Sedimentisphaerales bacterium]
MKTSTTIRSLLGLLTFAVAVGTCLAESPSVQSPVCEYKTNPLGIDVKKPRLSWKITSSDRAVTQSAYQIHAAAHVDDLKSGRDLLWDSGKAESDRSIHVVYEGPAPESRQRIWWQVRVWDDGGRNSDWSEPAFWEMGLLTPGDWSAEWIEPNLSEAANISNPCPMLRREFMSAKGKIKSARAYVTCHGLYQMQINGRIVGDELFTPGWTAYLHRLQYQTYDVTGLLNAGKNCVGVILGDGWYRGRLAWKERRNVYGKKLALLAQIEIEYEDGTRQVINTDGDWKASTGPILMSDIYNGEVYDAHLEMADWSKPGFDDKGWAGVTAANYAKDILVAPAGPPVRKIEEIRPLEMLKTPAGETVVDMGQNMVGWVRLNVRGPAGTCVRLRHAEVLDAQGNFYTENLRAAKQTVEYILKGGGEEVFEPHFTFQGFRYVAVEGWPGPLSLDDMTGVVIHSDIRPTGMFECSNPMINQLQHNIQWGQKGNFLDVPTDCPQRDERLGWTGDAQVFARTACFNADVAAFYTKWLADLAADQQPSGAVPHVIPNVLSLGQEKGESASAGWADAAVVVPWTVYLCYGDTRILEQQYSSMKAWVDYMAGRAGDSYFWNTDHTYGDWLAFNTNRSDYPGATTDKDLIRQAYFARSTDLLRRSAIVLGNKADAEKYGDLLEKVKKVFRDEFVTPNGRLASNTQTAYSLALAFDLLSGPTREIAAKRLADDVEQFGHITTGFLGASPICHVLSDYGYLDDAYMLLNRTEYPSWLYPITKGATTIWERWDGIKPDGTFQDKGMNSFNHYAYGAIGEWLYRVVAGLDIDEQNPGYKHIIIQPHPGGGLSFARARLDSMYGPIEAEWRVDGNTTTVTVEIPPNTTATVKLPSAKLSDVTEEGKPLSEASGIHLLQMRQEGNTAVIHIGSGQYLFRYSKRAWSAG